MNKLFKYFDLLSEVRAKRPTAVSDEGKKLHWLPQYVFLVLGIAVQPFFAAYQNTGQWELVGLGGRLAFSIVVGILLFPNVYKKSFDPEKPMFYQFCVIFTGGMGWESLLKTIMKGVTPS